MRIPLEFYDHLRKNIFPSDLIGKSINLSKKGDEYLGICPFHNEKTPSFTVNNAKMFYHCFGCAAHGDIIKFISEKSGLSYKESAIKIANDYGFELPKQTKESEQRYKKEDRIYSILKLAADFFHDNLNYEITSYLNKRGINNDTIKKFQLGFAPGNNKLENFFKSKSIDLNELIEVGLAGKKDGRIYSIFNERIIFPIHNIFNKVVGFGGRALGDRMPKYLNSPESLVFKKSDLLYGENFAKSSMHKDSYAIIVEGYMDVIALHQSGNDHAVASLGTAVTDSHLQRIWNSCDEIIVCLDGDSAGQRASNKLVNMSLPMIESSKLISFIDLPATLDPDDVIKKHGNSYFQKLISDRKSLSQKIWKIEFEKQIYKSAEEKAFLEKKLHDYCEVISDKTLKSNFYRFFKEMIWEHLVKFKKNAVASKPANPDIFSGKNYDEINYIEQSICSFLLQYPELITNELPEIDLKSTELNDFKNTLVEICIDKPSLNHNNLIDLIKTSGSFENNPILSNADILFKDINALRENGLELGKILDWLLKKHHLFLLKYECKELLECEGEKDLQDRVSSYVKEIQKVNQEINRLTESFIS